MGTSEYLILTIGIAFLCGYVVGGLTTWLVMRTDSTDWGDPDRVQKEIDEHEEFVNDIIEKLPNIAKRQAD